jgi:hypothetical protein
MKRQTHTFISCHACTLIALPPSRRPTDEQGNHYQDRTHPSIHANPKAVSECERHPHRICYLLLLSPGELQGRHKNSDSRSRDPTCGFGFVRVVLRLESVRLVLV